MYRCHGWWSSNDLGYQLSRSFPDFPAVSPSILLFDIQIGANKLQQVAECSCSHPESPCFYHGPIPSFPSFCWFKPYGSVCHYHMVQLGSVTIIGGLNLLFASTSAGANRSYYGSTYTRISDNNNSTLLLYNSTLLLYLIYYLIFLWSQFIVEFLYHQKSSFTVASSTQEYSKHSGSAGLFLLVLRLV